MNTKELQIGDWVLKRDEGYATVIGIDHLGTVDTSRGITIDMCLKPVPLTPEILVLNGFEKVPTAPHSYFNSDLWDCDVIIDISGDTYEDTWHVHKFTDHNDNAFVCFSLCYVHELQHVLRLCGLFESADNLKLE